MSRETDTVFPHSVDSTQQTYLKIVIIPDRSINGMIDMESPDCLMKESTARALNSEIVNEKVKM